MPDPCRTTQHCTNWGWCHRCNPTLAAAATHVVKAIDAAGIPAVESSAPYGQIMGVLRNAAETEAGQ